MQAEATQQAPVGRLLQKTTGGGYSGGLERIKQMAYFLLTGLYACFTHELVAIRDRLSLSGGLVLNYETMRPRSY